MDLLGSMAQAIRFLVAAGGRLNFIDQLLVVDSPLFEKGGLGLAGSLALGASEASCEVE